MRVAENARKWAKNGVYWSMGEIRVHLGYFLPFGGFDRGA